MTISFADQVAIVTGAGAVWSLPCPRAGAPWRQSGSE